MKGVTREPNWYIVSYHLGWKLGAELELDLNFKAWTAADAKLQAPYELKLQAPYIAWDGIHEIRITNIRPGTSSIPVFEPNPRRKCSVCGDQFSICHGLHP